MNSTTANPTSGSFLGMGVSSRPDARKNAAAEPAGQGDFQRLLKQAADKKTAVQQQQQRRLEEDKLQANKAQEKHRQTSIDKLHSEEITKPEQSDGRDKVSVGGTSSSPSSAQTAEHHEQLESTSTLAEAALEQPEWVEAPLLGSHPASPDTAEPQRFPEDWLPVSLELPGSVSLEEIAQAVADMAGAALMGAAGGIAGREQVAGMAGAFRSSPSAGAYLPAQSASAQALSDYADQALAGNLTDSLADKATTAPDLNLTTLSRQLLGVAAANTGAASGMAASPLAEVSTEAASARDTALSGSLSPLGQPVDGKPAAGAAQFNPSAGLKGGLGQPEWHNAIAERVAVMASKKLTSAEIQLDPPELGQLLVRVTLNQEQASVTFSSQHAAVREALDQTAHRLREMFDAEGLNLVDVDVSDRSFQQGREHAAVAGQGGDAGDTDEDPAAQPVLVRQGLIDQFV